MIYDYLSERNDPYLTKTINILHFLLETYRSIMLFKLEAEYRDVLISLASSIKKTQRKIEKLSNEFRKNGDMDMAEALSIIARSDIPTLVANSRDVIVKLDYLNDRRSKKFTRDLSNY